MTPPQPELFRVVAAMSGSALNCIQSFLATLPEHPPPPAPSNFPITYSRPIAYLPPSSRTHKHYRHIQTHYRSSSCTFPRGRLSPGRYRLLFAPHDRMKFAEGIWKDFLDTTADRVVTLPAKASGWCVVCGVCLFTSHPRTPPVLLSHDCLHVAGSCSQTRTPTPIRSQPRDLRPARCLYCNHIRVVTVH